MACWLAIARRCGSSTSSVPRSCFAVRPGAVRNEASFGKFGNVPGIAPDAAAEAELNIIRGNNATETKTVRIFPAATGGWFPFGELGHSVVEFLGAGTAPADGVDIRH